MAPGLVLLKVFRACNGFNRVSSVFHKVSCVLFVIFGHFGPY